MRDERRKEERNKQDQTNNKVKQHSTPKAVTFPKKNELPRVGLEPTTLYTPGRDMHVYIYMYIVCMYVYCVFQCTDSSDGESGAEEEGGGGGGDNPLSGLRAKMKELSTSHDLVTKNRCVCVYHVRVYMCNIASVSNT